MTKFCEGCAVHGPKDFPGVGTFQFPDGHIAVGCRRHLSEWRQSVPVAFGQGGPYRGETGSKGGGDSVEAAKRWNGKAGDLRRKVLVYVAEHGALEDRGHRACVDQAVACS